MKKVLAIGASNSSRSINRQFASWAAQQVADAEVTTLDLNDFSMPLFGVDLERSAGVPEEAQRFCQLIAEHDGLVISLAEHNGNYSAAFKNVMDWASRLNKRVWQDKPMLLLSTSPGRRGGATVMQVALNYFPYLGGNVVTHFSLPSFRDNFSTDTGIVDAELAANFEQAIESFALALATEDAAIK